MIAVPERPDDVEPWRWRRALELAAATSDVGVPYPSREAVDPADAVLLAYVETLSDPVWLARNVVRDREGDDHER